MTTPMSKLKKTYSQKQSLPVSSLRFFFDGRRIDDDETPSSVSCVDREALLVSSLLLLNDSSCVLFIAWDGR